MAKRFLYWCLIGIFAALLLFSAYKIISYYTEINEGQEDTPTDPPSTVPISTDPTALEATQPIPTEPAMAEVIGPDGQPMPILPEYKRIYELNNDFAGWLCIEGTNINFPVLYKPDSRDYYLNRDFYGDWSSQGAIYIRE